MLKKLELTHDEQIDLKNYCITKNIEFLTTAFDLESLELINQMNLKRFKIPSGEITNLPYLRKIGSLGKINYFIYWNVKYAGNKISVKSIVFSRDI